MSRLANAFLAAGITKGDKVSTVMTNRLEFVLMCLAVAKTGIVVVPVGTLLNEMGLKRLLTDPDSVLVVADASYAGILRDIRCNLPAIELDRFILAGVDRAPAGFLSFEDFVGNASETEPPDAALVDEDVYNIM